MNKQTITYALTMAVFLGSAALFPSFASETQIVGNGAFSNRDVSANTSNMTEVNQNNVSNIENNIQTMNSTGNNAASFNTGSNVEVMTGNATANVGITNITGSNTANVSGNENNGSQNTVVAGNGAFSDTSVQMDTMNSMSVDQGSAANVSNTVAVDNNTGDNRANFNTGSDVTIHSGDANAFVGITNATGGNTANVFGGNGLNGQNTAIVGNGAFSNNAVSVSSNNSRSLNQSDIANLATNVALNNSTGNNGASFNTGSNVSIMSGNANAQVGVSNLTGSNVANVWGMGSNDWVNTSIGGNGAFSSNSVTTRNSNRTALTQSNLSSVANYIESMNNTGNNNAGFNTGSNVAVASGNANSWVALFNTPGVNVANLMGGDMGGYSNTRVLGNGAFSNNSVSTMQENETALDQQNTASVSNRFMFENNTGDNSARYSTNGWLGSSANWMPGYSYARSGNASAGVSVQNLASANYLSY